MTFSQGQLSPLEVLETRLPRSLGDLTLSLTKYARGRSPGPHRSSFRPRAPSPRFLRVTFWHRKSQGLLLGRGLRRLTFFPPPCGARTCGLASRGSFGLSRGADFSSLPSLSFQGLCKEAGLPVPETWCPLSTAVLMQRCLSWARDGTAARLKPPVGGFLLMDLR